MPDVNTAVEPSAPATPVVFDSWDEKGTPIVSKKDTATSNAEPPKTQEAEPASTPETKATPEPEGKSAAEPGAAPKQEKVRKPGEKLSADERIGQLTAEVRKLEERLREREAAPKPPAETKTEAKVEPPKRPNPFKWTGTPEEYEAAQDAWENHVRAQTALQVKQQQQWEQMEQKNREMLKQAAEKYPDAEVKIKQATGEIFNNSPEFVKIFVSDSEVLGDLLYTLSDTTVLNNLLETAKTQPSKALRVLRDMELDITKAVSKEPPKAEAKNDPPVTPTPRAPKPPAEVGGRGTSLEDAQVSAARSGDYSRFEEEENRRKFVRA